VAISAYFFLSKAPEMSSSEVIDPIKNNVPKVAEKEFTSLLTPTKDALGNAVNDVKRSALNDLQIDKSQVKAELIDELKADAEKVAASGDEFAKSKTDTVSTNMSSDSETAKEIELDFAVKSEIKKVDNAKEAEKKSEKKEIDKKEAEKKEVDVQVGDVSTASEAVEQGNDMLKLNFAKDSWTEVIDAKGKKLVYSMKGAGDVVTVTGAAPFKVKVGIPGSTQLEFNGKQFPIKETKKNNPVTFTVQ
ncbi:MAG: DUF4115 domain-containing protein, partial [Pseudomonadota bacterium]